MTRDEYNAVRYRRMGYSWQLRIAVLFILGVLK